MDKDKEESQNLNKYFHKQNTAKTYYDEESKTPKHSWHNKDYMRINTLTPIDNIKNNKGKYILFTLLIFNVSNYSTKYRKQI